mmetsp:Transcript_39442/g.108639  ORF Transcript_39442/g.108639 Transcript_39442/m.108639 type:complete len:457 (-) Transcript_39442:222-1592(-)
MSSYRCSARQHAEDTRRSRTAPGRSMSSDVDASIAGVPSNKFNRFPWVKRVHGKKWASEPWLTGMPEGQVNGQRVSYTCKVDPASRQLHPGHDGAAGVVSTAKHLVQFLDPTQTVASIGLLENNTRRGKECNAKYVHVTDTVTARGGSRKSEAYRPLRRTNFKKNGLYSYHFSISSGSELPKDKLSDKEMEKIRGCTKSPSPCGGMQYFIAGGEDLGRPVQRNEFEPSADLVRYNSYRGFPDVPRRRPGSKQHVKCDVPASKDVMHHNKKKLPMKHERGLQPSASPHLVQSPDMFYILRGAKEKTDFTDRWETGSVDSQLSTQTPISPSIGEVCKHTARSESDPPLSLSARSARSAPSPAMMHGEGPRSFSSYSLSPRRGSRRRPSRKWSVAGSAIRAKPGEVTGPRSCMSESGASSTVSKPRRLRRRPSSASSATHSCAAKRTLRPATPLEPRRL